MTQHIKNYGDRDIRVCDEWANFETFYEWALNAGYDNNLTIDRIDVNDNYKPSNCKWSTMVEQNNNKRNNIVIEYKNEKHSIAEWASIMKIPYKTMYSRYVRKCTNETMFKQHIKTLLKNEDTLCK